MSKTTNNYLKLFEQLYDKKITRREFVRYATLVGMSAAAAYQTSGLFFPQKSFAAEITRGGVLKIATQIPEIKDPAQLSWNEPSNIVRTVAEYLTYTDKDNITHPYLLQNWKADTDLKTWTLNLRSGIKFNNGDELTADDLVFNFKRWLNKDTGSSMSGLIGGYLNESGIEKSGKYQIKLHLEYPEIGVPEHLFHYPGVILNHRTFEGDFMQKPHGTGPYTVEFFNPGELCRLKRRNDYWQKGADGVSLPYLDSIEFVDMGKDIFACIASLQTREVDIIDFGFANVRTIYEALKNDSRVNIISIGTANTQVLRMRSDMEPWNDNKVRTALKLCQHREKIRALTYMGKGRLGHDFHVCPIHPEYCEKAIPKYQPEKAKELLKKAGYPDGLTVEISISKDWEDVLRYAEILKLDASRGGFNININSMPSSDYWKIWTETPFGITPWSGRPLGTMVLNLGYSGDKNGNPVPWNETRWIDKEFESLLKKANGTLNINARRDLFCKLEDIQTERGSIGIAWWQNYWLITSKRVQGIKPHPAGYILSNDVYMVNKNSKKK